MLNLRAAGIQKVMHFYDSGGAIIKPSPFCYLAIVGALVRVCVCVCGRRQPLPYHPNLLICV